MTESTDRRDMCELADAYLDIKRCFGGRLVVSGYSCLHCDSAQPGKICRKKGEIVLDEYNFEPKAYVGWTVRQGSLSRKSTGRKLYVVNNELMTRKEAKAFEVRQQMQVAR